MAINDMPFKEKQAIYQQIESDLNDAKFDRNYWDQKIADEDFDGITKEIAENARAKASIAVANLSAMIRSMEEYF